MASFDVCGGRVFLIIFYNLLCHSFELKVNSLSCKLVECVRSVGVWKQEKLCSMAF